VWDRFGGAAITSPPANGRATYCYTRWRSISGSSRSLRAVFATIAIQRGLSTRSRNWWRGASMDGRWAVKT